MEEFDGLINFEALRNYEGSLGKAVINTVFPSVKFDSEGKGRRPNEITEAVHSLQEMWKEVSRKKRVV